MTTDPDRMRSATKVFCAAFGGSLGFLWLLVSVYSHFKLQWFRQPETNSLLVTIMILLSVAVASCAVWVRLLHQPAMPAQAPTFEQSLVGALSTALRDRDYADVIRIGVALNRPLFEEGKFSTRLKIGKVVEEAAALSGRKDVQVVALIDSIGWSLVEMGMYDEAKRHRCPAIL